MNDSDVRDAPYPCTPEGRAFSEAVIARGHIESRLRGRSEWVSHWDDVWGQVWRPAANSPYRDQWLAADALVQQTERLLRSIHLADNLTKPNYTPAPWGLTTERSCRKPLLWIWQAATHGGVQKTVYDAESPDVFPLKPEDAQIIAAAPEMADLLFDLDSELTLSGLPVGSSVELLEVTNKVRALAARLKESCR
jgi:hypothetical protein